MANPTSVVQKMKNHVMRVKESEEQSQVENTKKMTLEEMSKMKVSFGEKHRGSTFEMAFKDVKWAEWFVSTYWQSTKPEHVQFIQYVERQLDTDALNDKRVDPKGYMAMTKGEPKPKSSAASEAAAEAAASLTEWDAVSVEDAPSSHVVDLQEQVRNMQMDQQNVHQRISGVEMAIHELINHIKGLQVKTES